MSTESMVKGMEKHLGLVGRPNVITKAYAARNGAYFEKAPWCNMTITEVARATGNYNEVCFGKDFAYTVWHAQEFQRRGQWHTDVAGIQRGDIVFFDWGGSNSIAHIDHIGIVTDVNGRDILTIEGNTADRCARRVRHADTIAGYGRPKYREAAAPAQPAAMTYTVKRGDTLSKIGQVLGIQWQDIASLNGLRSPYTITPGQALRLPGRPPAKK
ncbi:LysM peptidoglycan-binding domain-containing protein [Streptomyces sp. NPDC012769]|uniref:CHAP and LysM peptidoglycan-binding domain-containing protein n=1 Tax=Streptomyces sp. NPDC012769 TaxID=3364848 RepID=UPI0036C6250D